MPAQPRPNSVPSAASLWVSPSRQGTGSVPTAVKWWQANSARIAAPLPCKPGPSAGPLRFLHNATHPYHGKKDPGPMDRDLFVRQISRSNEPADPRKPCRDGPQLDTAYKNIGKISLFLSENTRFPPFSLQKLDFGKA